MTVAARAASCPQDCRASSLKPDSLTAKLCSPSQVSWDSSRMCTATGPAPGWGKPWVSSGLAGGAGGGGWGRPCCAGMDLVERSAGGGRRGGCRGGSALDGRREGAVRGPALLWGGCRLPAAEGGLQGGQLGGGDLRGGALGDGYGHPHDRVLPGSLHLLVRQLRRALSGVEGVLEAPLQPEGRMSAHGLACSRRGVAAGAAVTQWGRSVPVRG